LNQKVKIATLKNRVHFQTFTFFGVRSENRIVGTTAMRAVWAQRGVTLIPPAHSLLKIVAAGGAA